MEGRKQFTFYRSFWEAVSGLPKKDQLPVLCAIILYGLDGATPQGLTKTQNAFFLLVKPTLDASRKKAEIGKQGGSKPKAKRKQTEREKENEKENEKEKEKENEIEIERENEGTLSDPLFSCFWEEYPSGSRGDISAARDAWAALSMTETEKGHALDTLRKWKRSARWLSDGGAFIPNAVNYLAPERGYLCADPPPAETKSAGTVWGGGEAGQQDLEIVKRMMMEG